MTRAGKVKKEGKAREEEWEETEEGKRERKGVGGGQDRR
jgi:hypothetical protein